MTATAGIMLVSKVMPLIAAAIARGAVKPVGAEDAEELKSEACALAAATLESIERRGKQVTPGNIAYYAIQALKSGRRSCGNRTTDVMGAGTSLCGRVHVTSMDQPLASDNDAPDETITLHEALAATGEGPDESAGRQMDWAAVYDTIGGRQRRVLRDTATGITPSVTAEELELSRPRITQLRREIAGRICDTWRTDRPINAAMCEPAWRRHLTAYRERRTCRAERTHALRR